MAHRVRSHVLRHIRRVQTCIRRTISQVPHHENSAAKASGLGCYICGTLWVHNGHVMLGWAQDVGLELECNLCYARSGNSCPNAMRSVTPANALQGAGRLETGCMRLALRALERMAVGYLTPL